MRSLDVRLLRAHFLGEVYALPGIYPRRTVVTLADSVGASRITVSRRLAKWREDGFWKGIIAFPNPDAIGMRFQFQAVLLEHGRNRLHFEKAIRETFEPLILFQIESVYGACFLSRSPADVARRARVFQRVSGCRLITPVVNLPFPGSVLDLTPRDWRILQAFRRSPEPDWARIASEAGMSVRGLQRRVDRLMSSNALFFQPLLDFRRLPMSVAWVGLLCGTGIDLRRLRIRLTERYPDMLEVDPVPPLDTFLPAEDRPPFHRSVSFLVPVASGSSADELRRELGTLSGVVDVIVGFPTQNMTVATGVDSEIARAVEQASAPR